MSGYLVIPLAFAAGFAAAMLIARARNAASVATLRADLAHARQSAADAATSHAALAQQMRDAFAALAAQSLEANNAQFIALATATFGELRTAATGDLDLRHQRIDELVRPVREGLERVQGALVEFDKQRAAGAAGLDQQLRDLGALHQRLAGSTNDLVQALRAPQGRGQWGEMQLRRVVELAGMERYCDFQEQVHVATEEGRLRPDLIVKLPGDKLVIVDAKAPMSAYLEAVHAESDARRELLLDQHAKQVRKHIDALASKDYASELTEATDFVVMFLPGEDFFSAACRRDPALIDYAVQQGVMPASPITLITLLKAVAYGWQQSKLSENAARIRALGEEMHDRIRILVEHLNGVRKGLQGAVESFNKAVGSLEARVMPTGRRFADLGAGSGGEIERLEPVDAAVRGLPSPEANDETRELPRSATGD